MIVTYTASYVRLHSTAELRSVQSKDICDV